MEANEAIVSAFFLTFPLFHTNKNPSAAKMETETQLRWKEEPALRDKPSQVDLGVMFPLLSKRLFNF